MHNFAVREFRAASHIFLEGSRGNTAYILKEGRVTIYTVVHGENYVLAELTAPTIFGEMALLSNDHMRTASAEANTKVVVIEIQQAKFNEILSKSPTLITLVIQTLAKRLNETTSIVKKSA
jgi:CRP/FNR family cyclic AMP-dependent transcriptional regulator